MTILNRLLEISVYAVILFIAIIAIKKALHQKISPVMHFFIWFLMIARLCVPVTIDSEIKLFVIPAQAPETAAAIQQAPSSEHHSVDTIVQSQTNLSSLSNIQSQQKTTAPQSQAPSNAKAVPQPATALTWPDYVISAWLTGVFIFALWLLLTMRKMNRMIKQHGTKPSLRVLQIVTACKNELRIRKNISVRIMRRLSTPALTVGLRPKMILPADMAETLNDQQLAFAIKHELTHYKRGDHVTGLLLRLLLAAYWFNPVVWLMGKFMVDDMETACDSMVLKTLDQQQKKQYVLTLLDMFSGSKAPQYLLGMALSHTEKNAEKRIRGAYMNCKSKRSTKLMAGVLAIILFVGCFTTACQPTPEKPVVVNKADGLDSLIEATPSASCSESPSNTAQPNNDALYEKLAAPRHWTFEEKALDGKLNLAADVDIELPNVAQLPAATAVLSEFTQEDLDKIAKVLGVEDCVWTEIDHTMTKDQIEQEILDYKARRAEFKAEGNDELVKQMDENIEAYEQMYDDAPSEIKPQNIEFKIGEISSCEDLKTGEKLTETGFQGTTQVNNQSFFFYAGSAINDDSVKWIRAIYGTELDFFGGIYVDKPFGISLTKEQAEIKAGEIAKKLSEDLKLCHVYPSTTLIQEAGRKWGWACVFMREINGCPTAYESTGIGSDIKTTLKNPIAYEQMTIVMDDQGMVSFEWQTPMAIKSIDNPDVSLLPFDQIAERAKEGVVQRWAYETVGRKNNEGKDVSDPGCTAKITKVELGLMRVAKANSDDYYYIPVWNFFSDLEHTPGYYERMGFEPASKYETVDENGNINSGVADGDPFAWGAITVNALDGSIIDRNLGY